LPLFLSLGSSTAEERFRSAYISEVSLQVCSYQLPSLNCWLELLDRLYVCCPTRRRFICFHIKPCRRQSLSIKHLHDCLCARYGGETMSTPDLIETAALVVDSRGESMSILWALCIWQITLVPSTTIFGDQRFSNCIIILYKLRSAQNIIWGSNRILTPCLTSLLYPMRVVFWFFPKQFDLRFVLNLSHTISHTAKSFIHES
jgi:hypothetical protein